MGVDEIYQGKREKFLTVVCRPETARSCCGLAGGTQARDPRRILSLSVVQPATHPIEAACVDTRETFG